MAFIAEWGILGYTEALWEKQGIMGNLAFWEKGGKFKNMNNFLQLFTSIEIHFVNEDQQITLKYDG